MKLETLKLLIEESNEQLRFFIAEAEQEDVEWPQKVELGVVVVTSLYINNECILRETPMITDVEVE